MLRTAAALSRGGVAASGPIGSRFQSTATKIKAPPMVFIRGEEMTRYCMDLIMQVWQPSFKLIHSREMCTCVPRAGSQDASSSSQEYGADEHGDPLVCCGWAALSLPRILLGMSCSGCLHSASIIV
eukprot:6196998-Pleurochrysis_carterae.AAC.2